MKTRVDPETYGWLLREFMRHASGIVERYKIEPGILLNMRRKPQAVLVPRRTLVRIMRTEYVQTRKPPLRFYSVLDPPPVEQVIRLSTTIVSRLFGGNHSTVVIMEKREAARSGNEVAMADSTR